jgi:hypothetical protein
MQVGQEVYWLDCPGSIPAYHTYLRGLSPCGKYALLGWVRNAVAVTTLKPLDVYHMLPSRNHWGIDGIDQDTGDKLDQWVEEYERRTAIN